MTKLLRGIVLVSLLVFILALSAQGGFWVKGQGFHYSPDYGPLGATLEEKAEFYEVVKKLEGGYGTAFSAGYDFENNWGIRLDTFSFTGVADYHRPHTKVLIKTSTSPTILSCVYRISSLKSNSYLGAGIGIFRSELTAFSCVTLKGHPGHLIEDYQIDSPIGFQIVGGVEFESKDGVFLSTEVRYLSAKTTYPEFQCIPDCSTDWSGFFISVGMGVHLW